MKHEFILKRHHFTLIFYLILIVLGGDLLGYFFIEHPIVYKLLNVVVEKIFHHYFQPCS